MVRGKTSGLPRKSIPTACFLRSRHCKRKPVLSLSYALSDQLSGGPTDTWNRCRGGPQRLRYSVPKVRRTPPQEAPRRRALGKSDEFRPCTLTALVNWVKVEVPLPERDARPASSSAERDEEGRGARDGSQPPPAAFGLPGDSTGQRWPGARTCPPRPALNHLPATPLLL